MGTLQQGPVDRDVNKHKFKTKEIHSKAGIQRKVWKGIKSIFLFVPSLIISVFGYFLTGKNPFEIITDILFDKYCKNISNEQKINLTKLINDEFDVIFNSIIKEIDDFIQFIIKENNIENLTIKKFKKLKDDIKNISDNSKKINILLIGKTGVGKSTLINSLLEKDVAKESLGKIGTLRFNYYSSPKWKDINLIDSQGFDLSKPFKFFVNDALDFIESNNEDKLKFIDLIYYCFTGLRFESNEKELILNLIELYEQINIPIIFINTQSITDEFEKMKEYIKKDFNNKDLIITEVLAKSKTLKNGVKFPSFGLKELKLITEKQFQNIKETAYYKKFYRNCLNKLYESNIIYKAANIKLETFIEQALVSNLQKFSFSKVKYEKNNEVNRRIKNISDKFLISFNCGIKKIAELMIDFRVETEIEYEKEIKNINHTKDQKSEAEEMKKKIGVEKFQKEIQDLILQQYFKCFNEIIRNKFEEKLQNIYDSNINIIYNQF